MTAKIALHPALTHAQAQHVCREHGLEVLQDGRGNLRVERKPEQERPRDDDPPPTPRAA